MQWRDVQMQAAAINFRHALVYEMPLSDIQREPERSGDCSTAIRSRESMLRVTVETFGTALRLKVEGRLAGPCVPEPEQSWRRLIRSPGVGLIADLTDTEFVDLAGTYLLSLMYRSGVQLKANSPYMKCVIAEITEKARVEDAKRWPRCSPARGETVRRLLRGNAEGPGRPVIVPDEPEGR